MLSTPRARRENPTVSRPLRNGCPKIPDGYYLARLGRANFLVASGTPVAAQLVSSVSLLRLRDDSDVGLWLFPTLRITLLRFVVGDRTGDDYILAWFPVQRRGDLVLCSQLQRVNHAQHFVKVAARCHR